MFATFLFELVECYVLDANNVRLSGIILLLRNERDKLILFIFVNIIGS